VIGEQEAAAAFEDGSALDLDGAVTLALTLLEEARMGANKERVVP
jgi:hypothetical protein